MPPSNRALSFGVRKPMREGSTAGRGSVSWLWNRMKSGGTTGGGNLQNARVRRQDVPRSVNPPAPPDTKVTHRQNQRTFVVPTNEERNKNNLGLFC